MESTQKHYPHTLAPAHDIAFTPFLLFAKQLPSPLSSSPSPFLLTTLFHQQTQHILTFRGHDSRKTVLYNCENLRAQVYSISQVCYVGDRSQRMRTDFCRGDNFLYWILYWKWVIFEKEWLGMNILAYYYNEISNKTARRLCP